MFGRTSLFAFCYHRLFWDKSYRRRLTLSTIVFLGAFIFIISNYRLFASWSLTVCEPGGVYGFLFRNKNNARNILTTVIPAMALVDRRQGSHRISTPGQTIIVNILKPFYVDRQDLDSFLKAQIPSLALLKTNQVAPVMANPNPESKTELKLPASFPLSQDTLIAIYHTHTGETYARTDGKERLDGQHGGVVAVGAAIKEELESKYAIKTIHVDKIHDEKYNMAYLKSEETARELIANYPELVLLLDIHRDIKKNRKNSLIKVNGQEVAPLFFVVGSGARAPFPTWQQNYELAKTLTREIEEKYPGLCLGVEVKEGRYNQFLHPGILIMEIGNVNNSTAEATAAGRLLADVLAQVILTARQKHLTLS
ncbi:MAG: hypothetical protein STSR0004_17830 [Peptococcaceae bacterium]